MSGPDARESGADESGAEGSGAYEPGVEESGADDHAGHEPHAHRAKPRRRAVHGASALIGVLTLLLGFAIAVQLHANSGVDALSGLQEDDLIGILDNQDARADRLRQQIATLQQNLAELRNSGDRSSAARTQAEQERTTLQILLGTIAAHGSGVVVRVADPQGRLDGEQLLDVVEELRGAGAEAIQFGTVRISTDSAFTGAGGAVSVDGKAQTSPYTVIAIGDPKTLDTALNIPGGVAASVRTAGGSLTVSERTTVSVSAVRALPSPHYAKPSR